MKGNELGEGSRGIRCASRVAKEAPRPAGFWLASALALALLALVPILAKAQPALVAGPGECRSLHGHAAGLVDEQMELAVGDVISPGFEGKFVPVEEIDFSRLTAGPWPERFAVWIRFELEPGRDDSGQGPTSLAFNIQSDSLVGAELYRVRGTDGRSPAFPVSLERAGLGEADDYAFSLIGWLPEDASGDYYLRVVLRGPAPLRLDVCDGSALVLGSETRMGWYGFYHGIIHALVLLHLILFIKLGDRSYLWFALFHMFTTMMVMGVNGITGRYLPEVLDMPLLFMGLPTALLFVTAGQFTRSFLMTREQTPLIDKFLIAYMFVAGLAVVALTWGLPVAMFHFIMILVFAQPLLFMGAAVVCHLKGFPPAKFFLAAWGCFTVGQLITIFMVIGSPRISTPELEYFQIGSALEAILISFALAERLRLQRERGRELEQARDLAERERGASEERLVLAMEATSDGVWDWNLETDEYYFSPGFYRLLGYEPEEFENREIDFESLIIPDNRAAISARLDALLESGEDGYETDIELKTRSGAVRYVLARGRVVERDGEGRPRRLVGTLIDVTDKKRDQEQIFRAQKLAALGQVVAGVAHEINNPNNFISFNLPALRQYVEAAVAELAAGRGDGELTIMGMPAEKWSADVQKLIDSMALGSDRINKIVGDLRTYIRGHEEDDRKPIDIGHVFDHVETLVGKQVRKTVSTFEASIKQGLPPVIGSSGRIEQVLINLLINASQAAGGPGSRVRLSARLAPDGGVEISVEDNGPGMDQETMDKIFDPFFTTKGRETGSGLGLSISQRIVADHGGEISAESEPGGGATFTVWLPAGEGDEP